MLGLAVTPILGKDLGVAGSAVDGFTLTTTGIIYWSLSSGTSYNLPEEVSKHELTYGGSPWSAFVRPTQGKGDWDVLSVTLRDWSSSIHLSDPSCLSILLLEASMVVMT
ncbi:hypothetical protein Salat_1536700 [Sesamum alatum]|uniref:Uncharacterized protein n=1 Tax=Sesamum alatum TaxID=300844 RepID=A0AAE1YCV9_9LAMI|nr:hypothetical protein Salat_1536700 [Sesamum alatum]